MLVSLEPEVILLGTGRRLVFPEPQVLATVHAATIGIEIMDTAAACRTYNILAGESRHVAAALIIDRATGTEA